MKNVGIIFLGMLISFTISIVALVGIIITYSNATELAIIYATICVIFFIVGKILHHKIAEVPKIKSLVMAFTALSFGLLWIGMFITFTVAIINFCVGHFNLAIIYGFITSVLFVVTFFIYHHMQEVKRKIINKGK